MHLVINAEIATPDAMLDVMLYVLLARPAAQHGLVHPTRTRPSTIMLRALNVHVAFLSRLLGFGPTTRLELG